MTKEKNYKNICMFIQRRNLSPFEIVKFKILYRELKRKDK